jgi:hypothetical protein
MNMKLCTVRGCTEPHAARGYCAAHYQRQRRDGDLRLADPVRKQRPKMTPLVREAECRRCHVTKPIGAFPVNAKYRLGHSTWCKECHSAATLEARRRSVAQQRGQFGHSEFERSVADGVDRFGQETADARDATPGGMSTERRVLGAS